jgi:hypothetical protein
VNEETDIGEEPRDEIARLEARLEELADGLERCRKIGLFSKVLLAGGAVWLIAGMTGIVYFGPAVLGSSITAILGGIVLNGSNRSSMRQIQSAIETAENRRTALIGAIDFLTVDDRQEPENAAPSRRLH